MPVSVSLADGLLEVEGDGSILDRLRAKLRCYRRSIESVNYRKKVVGTYEDLYSGEDLIVQTMPGFAHRVLDFLRSNGIPHVFTDRRTPMPRPDLAAALDGLRPYQKELVCRMLKSGGGILQAATGAGKTVIASALVKAFHREELLSRGTPVSVFACPDRDINRKNALEFQKWLPGRRVGLVMSGAAKGPMDDVVCCTIDSLDNIDPDTVGVLIVDEMHASASSARMGKISAFRKAVRWGVSATPYGRFDGADMVSEGLYGPVVATFTYQDGVKAGALVPIDVYWIPAPPPACGLHVYGGLVDRDAKLRHGSTANPDFARLVAGLLDSIPESRQTLCIVQYLEHMSRIMREVSGGTRYMHAGTDPSKMPPGGIIEAVPAKERKRLYEAFRDREISSMVATWCWKQGVDFPQLEVIVNAGGGGSDIVAKQIPGRASRSADGKDRAYVVDFIHRWDRENPVTGAGKPGPLLSNDMARRRAYDQLGFRQVECKPTELTKLPFLDGTRAAGILAPLPATWRKLP